MKLRYLFLGILLVLLGILVSLQLGSMQSSQSGSTTTINRSHSLSGWNLRVNFSNGTAKTIRINETGDSLFFYMNESLSVKYKEYPGLGAFILCIYDVCQNSSHYWFLFVNGNFSKVGASSYYPKAGDNVTWMFLRLDESANYTKNIFK